MSTHTFTARRHIGACAPCSRNAHEMKQALFAGRLFVEILCWQNLFNGQQQQQQAAIFGTEVCSHSRRVHIVTPHTHTHACNEHAHARRQPYPHPNPTLTLSTVPQTTLPRAYLLMPHAHSTLHTLSLCPVHTSRCASELCALPFMSLSHPARSRIILPARQASWIWPFTSSYA